MADSGNTSPKKQTPLPEVPPTSDANKNGKQDPQKDKTSSLSPLAVGICVLQIILLLSNLIFGAINLMLIQEIQKNEDPHPSAQESNEYDGATKSPIGSTESSWQEPPGAVNLFDGDFEWGGIDAYGNDTENDQQLRSGYISVTPGTVYTLGVAAPGEPCPTSNVFEYDQNKQLIRRPKIVTVYSPFTFAASAETTYIRFCTTGNRPDVTMKHVQMADYWLEEGTESTPWNRYIAQFQSDTAENEGVVNALERLSYLCDYPLTTAGDGMTIGYKSALRQGTSNPYDSVNLKEGSTIYGFPYSSVRKTDTYVGYEISIDTFLSALHNPASILYTSNYQDPKDSGYSSWVKYAWSPYGVVCSIAVGYALNWDIRYTTYEVDKIPDLKKIDLQTDGVKLCDVLCNVTSEDTSGGHMTIVTDILRDKDGNIRFVELTEAGIPGMTRTYLFYDYFKNQYTKTYSLYRYTELDKVPPGESIYLKNPLAYNNALAADRGNFSVYPLGATVQINVTESNAVSLNISYCEEKEGNYTEIAVLPVSDCVETEINGNLYQILSYRPETCGFYRVVCLREDGSASDPIEFASASPGTVSYGQDDLITENTVARGETFRIYFSDEMGCTPLYACIETEKYVTREQRLLTGKELRQGYADLTYNGPAGNMYVKLYYENEYGRICSQGLTLYVTE